MVVSHRGEADPVRTYANVLRNAWDDALFEYYFAAGLARIRTDGTVQAVPAPAGLIEKFDASPDGAYVVVSRVLRPYSRLRPARYFASVIEVWDLAGGASEPTVYGPADTLRWSPVPEGPTLEIELATLLVS